MDIMTIFSVLMKYGIWALLPVAGITVIIIAVFAVYKKVFHGTKPFPKKQVIISILLAAWFFVVLGLTTFSRGANFTGKINISLFSSYINAWNKWYLSEYQLIIFNMLMFSPLGFLLPFLSDKSKKFSVACIVSFSVTLFIEMFQLLSGRGIFELDDLLHNFVGSMFGYFISAFILNCIEKKKIKKKYLARMLALPLLYGVLTLIAVINYNAQPYGNLPFIPAEKQDMSLVSIEKSGEISLNEQSVPMFKNIFADDYEHAKMISAKFGEFTNTEFSKIPRTDGSNKIFVSDKEQLTCFLKDGRWSYTNWEEAVSLSAAEASTWQKSVEVWLDENNLLPKEAKFSLQDNKILRWDMEAPKLQDCYDDFANGMIMVSVDANGSIASFDYFVIENKYVTDIQVISESEAYHDITDGNFEQYNLFTEGDTLYIEECVLDYEYDTKGFYRPVYRYVGYINNTDYAWECVVSAE